jgi:hypothetical protein
LSGLEREFKNQKQFHKYAICLKNILKPILIVGVIVACSIAVLAIGLSVDKIFLNQNNLDIEKQNLELDNTFKQDDSLSKITDESFEIKNTLDDESFVSTINVEIYGDTFDFSGEEHGLFALEYANPEFYGDNRSTIPEYTIGDNIGDFLMSYGLSLNDQCLVFVYGDRSFCTNNSNELTYSINGNPVSNIAFYEIEHGQKIEIKYQNSWNNNSSNLEESLENASKRVIEAENNSPLTLEESLENASKRVIEAENKINEQNKKIVNAVKPQVVINKGIVEMTLFDSKNNKYFWTMPVSTYDAFVKWDEDPTTTMEFDSGKIIRVGDFRPFVGTNFSNVIDDVYDNLENYDNFVLEILYMVSTLTIYSLDIGEDPRFAIETLVRGEGDCEDTVILFADMIRSSSHTKDWKLQLVYFDSDNPTNPQQINHVALLIDDGDTAPYIIETTAKTIDDFTMWSTTPIVGWFLDV